MKSLLPVLLLMFLFVSQSFGQVGIGTETPHPSAALEISSSSKGLLISRMSFNQRNAIEAPATGLLIYQTDGLKGFYYFDGQSWILLNPIQQIPQNINAEDPLTELVLSKVATSGDFSDLLNIPDFVYAADTTQMLMPYLTMSKLFPTLNLKADLVALQAESERAKKTELTLATSIDSKEDAANKSTDGTFADNSDEKFPTQKAVKTYVDGKEVVLNGNLTVLEGKVSGLTVGQENLAADLLMKENAANKSTDGTFSENSDEKFPSQRAVKTYLDTQIQNINGQFVDLSTNQEINGSKIFNNNLNVKASDGQQINIGLIDHVDNLVFGQANMVYAASRGRNNTVMGTFAFTSSSGSNNTVMGKDALRQGNSNVSGDNNTALGFRALSNGQEAFNNTAVGASAMESSVGENNTAVGVGAGSNVNEGSGNTFLGSQTNVASQDLKNATAIGYGAVASSSNSIQLGNTDVTSVKTSGKLTTGAITLPNEDGTNGQVLSTNGSGLVSWVTPSTASSSTFVDLTSTQEIAGAKTFSSDVVINELNIGKGGGNIVSNSVFGKYSLIQNTTGDINTAVGMSSLGSNTTGRGNSGFGYLSLYNNTTGSQNTGIGVAALEKNTTGISNVGLGFRALGENINGYENISIGHNSGINNVSGSSNIFIGSGANASGNFNNSIAIGTNALTTESNSIQLGNSSITTVKTSGQLTTGEITYPRVKGSEGQLLMTDGAGSASWTSTLSNGTTATTQAANDNSTKVATTAYVDRQVISGGAIDLPITELDGTSVVGIKTIFLTGQDGNYVDLRTLNDGVKGQVINLVFAPQNFNHKLEVIVNPTGNMAVPSGIIFDTNNTGGIVLIFDGVYWRVMNRPGSIN